MDIEMVFNELSTIPPATDIYKARIWMSNFTDLMINATARGVKRILRTREDFYSILLAPEYSIAYWYNDNSVDKEQKRFFYSISTKIPLLAGLENTEYADFERLSDFTFEGENAPGLGIAYLIEALAISILSSEKWNKSNLIIQLIRFEEKSLIERDVFVNHASKTEHIDNLSDWINGRLKDNIIDIKDLWIRRYELFPSLIFCDSVEDQISNIFPNNPIFHQIKNRLFEMQSFCDQWSKGPLIVKNLPGLATPESQATLERFAAERMFRCPDGETRIFSWHVKLTPGAWRIHFFPIENIRKIIIGYIGPHLPTVRHN